MNAINGIDLIAPNFSAGTTPAFIQGTFVNGRGDIVIQASRSITIRAPFIYFDGRQEDLTINPIPLTSPPARRVAQSLNQIYGTPPRAP
jgi:hypothetical protein